MSIYGLLGVDNDDKTELIGIFDSEESMFSYVERRRKDYHSNTLHFSALGYVISEFGEEVDIAEMYYLDWLNNKPL